MYPDVSVSNILLDVFCVENGGWIRDSLSSVGCSWGDSWILVGWRLTLTLNCNSNPFWDGVIVSVSLSEITFKNIS